MNHTGKLLFLMIAGFTAGVVVVMVLTSCRNPEAKAATIQAAESCVAAATVTGATEVAVACGIAEDLAQVFLLRRLDGGHDN